MTTERDPWLQQALRHAPDHDLPVPPPVREAILRAARLAVQSVAPVQPHRWLRAWQQLMAPWVQPARLGYSGAFMALLVVGLWGLDRLEQEAQPPRVPAVLATSEAAAPTSAPIAAAPAAPVAAAPRREAHADLADARTPVAAVAAGPRAALAAKAKAVASDRAAELARQQAVAAPAPTAALAAAPPESSAKKVAVAPDAPAVEMASVAATADATANAHAAAAQASVAHAERRVALAAATPAPSPAAAARAAPETPASTNLAAGLRPGLPRARFAPAAVRPVLSDSADPALDPVLGLSQGLSADTDARWQTPDAQGPFGARQTAWLERLRLATAGHWQKTVAAPGGPATVQWVGQNKLQGALWLADGVWLNLNGTSYWAALPPAQAAELERLRGEWP